MKDIALLAIDLDGTLLRDDVTISSYTKDVLKRAQARGIEILIATGRMFAGARPWGKVLGLGDVPMICYTGALVARCESGEVLSSRNLPLETAQAALDTIREQGWYVQMYIEDTLCVPVYEEQTRLYEARIGVTAHVMGEAFWKLTKAPTKILIFEQDHMPTVERVMKELYGDVTNQVKSTPYFFELNGKGLSKGAALAELCEKRGILSEQVMAFGNSENDLSLFSFTPHSYAVENGETVVKSAAAHVIPSNNDDGVAKTVEAYLEEP